ncbi:MAG: hypothetical protein DHS20C21_11920 [Gemmatimonadota bacterium]|nr:MAG: hypothetical protein DHS20C21_11920 [Gemmatimonadota bacterium]
MFSEFLSQGDLLAWPLLALAIFFTVFVGVLIQVFAGWRRPNALTEVTNLPLAGDDVAGSPGAEDLAR